MYMIEDQNGKRRLRTNFTEYQSSFLEEAFRKSHYPDPNTKKAMAITLGIPEDRLTVWFQNRRAKWRRKEVRDREKKKSKTPVNEKMPTKVDANVSLDLSADYFKISSQTTPSSYNSFLPTMFYEQKQHSLIPGHQLANDMPYECSNMLPPLNDCVQMHSSNEYAHLFAYPNSMY